MQPQGETSPGFSLIRRDFFSNILNVSLQYAVNSVQTDPFDIRRGFSFITAYFHGFRVKYALYSADIIICNRMLSIDRKGFIC